MTRLIQAIAAATLCMVAVGTTMAGDIVAGFPGECTIVARLDVQKFRSVPVVRGVLNDQLGQAAAFIEQIRQWTGVDLNTATALWIGVAKKDHGVFVLEGDFDVEEIKGAILNINGAQIVPKDFVPIAALLPDEKKPGTYNMGAVLDPNTIVLGQPEITEKYIDAYTKVGTGLDSDRLQRVRALEESQAIVHGFVLAIEQAELQKNPWLSYLTHGEFFANVDGDLDISLIIGVRNPDLAQPLQKILQGLIAVFRNMDEEHRKGNQLQKLLVDNATVAVDGDKLVLHSKLEERFINELVAAKLIGGGQQ